MKSTRLRGVLTGILVSCATSPTDGALPTTTASLSAPEPPAGDTTASPSSSARASITTAPVLTEKDESLTGLWGSGAEDVYAIGSKGSILHYDGSSWSRHYATGLALHSIWGSGPSDVYVSSERGPLLHYDGKDWTRVAHEFMPNARVWGAAPDDVWVTGAEGKVVRFDGKAWAVETVTKRTEDALAWDIDQVGGSPDSMFALTSGEVYQRTEAQWVKAPITSSRPGCARASWSAGSDAIAVGDFGTTLHKHGPRWRSVQNPSDVHLHAVQASGPEDAFAIGERAILHFDGAAWSTMKLPARFRPAALQVFAPDRVIAVGVGAAHYDGQAWSAMDLPVGFDSLSSIWGASPDDVWAVGNPGGIAHFDGSTWSSVNTPAPPSPAALASPQGAALCAVRDVTRDPDYVRGSPKDLIVEVLYENHGVGVAGPPPEPRSCGVKLPLGESQHDGVLSASSATRPLFSETFMKETFSFCKDAIFRERKPVHLQFDIGEVAVHSKELFCDDTGINEVRIRHSGGWMELRDTLNVVLFEHDLDGDASKELYVTSWQSCSGWLRVQRVRKQAPASGSGPDAKPR